MDEALSCRHCGSSCFKRNGLSRGTRRYLCRACGRTFTDTVPGFSPATGARALDMHLNNVGIRKLARFIGCSPVSVINWVRAAHEALRRERAAGRRAIEGEAADGAGDVVEMDEIYTFVQKNGRSVSKFDPLRTPWIFAQLFMPLECEVMKNGRCGFTAPNPQSTKS